MLEKRKPKISVRMVCPGEGCDGCLPVLTASGGRSNMDDERAITFFSDLEYICTKCGKSMVRKVFSLAVAETEVEIK